MDDLTDWWRRGGCKPILIQSIDISNNILEISIVSHYKCPIIIIDWRHSWITSISGKGRTGIGFV